MRFSGWHGVLQENVYWLRDMFVHAIAYIWPGPPPASYLRHYRGRSGPLSFSGAVLGTASRQISYRKKEQRVFPGQQPRESCIRRGRRCDEPESSASTSTRGRVGEVASRQ
jgi:hypothetical protein